MQRLASAFAGVTVALGLGFAGVTVAGCGDGPGSSEDLSKTSSAATARTSADDSGDRNGGYAPRGDGGRPADPRQQVDTTVARAYDALTGRGQPAAGGICSLMSRRARLQTTRYVLVASGVAKRWSCPSAVAYLEARVERRGELEDVGRTEVVGVTVKHGRATASVRSGPNGPISTILLVRRGGTWQLDTFPRGAP